MSHGGIIAHALRMPAHCKCATKDGFNVGRFGDLRHFEKIAHDAHDFSNKIRDYIYIMLLNLWFFFTKKITRNMRKKPKIARIGKPSAFKGIYSRATLMRNYAQAMRKH
jgi:hypothetical protein